MMWIVVLIIIVILLFVYFRPETFEGKVHKGGHGEYDQWCGDRNCGYFNMRDADGEEMDPPRIADEDAAAFCNSSRCTHCTMNYSGKYPHCAVKFGNVPPGEWYPMSVDPGYDFVVNY